MNATPTIKIFTMRFPHESALEQLYIADEHGAMIATVSVRCRAHSAEFTRLFVAAEHRRKGLASLLIKAVIDAARLKPDIEGLACTVHYKNIEAQAFYRSVGLFPIHEDGTDIIMGLQI